MEQADQYPISSSDEEPPQLDAFGEPLAPPGYFNDIYDEEYIRESNLFSLHSVTTIDPED